MALTVKQVEVWATSVADRPGGLAQKLVPLAEARANLEFVIARRAPDKPGSGVVFLAPIKGAAQMRAAQKVGLMRTLSLHSVRVGGPDRPGLGAKLTTALADAGVNLRGLSAAAIGKSFVAYLAFDSAEEAGKAVKVLKKLR